MRNVSRETFLYFLTRSVNKTQDNVSRETLLPQDIVPGGVKHCG